MIQPALMTVIIPHPAKVLQIYTWSNHRHGNVYNMARRYTPQIVIIQMLVHFSTLPYNVCSVDIYWMFYRWFQQPAVKKNCCIVITAWFLVVLGICELPKKYLWYNLSLSLLIYMHSIHPCWYSTGNCPSPLWWDYKRSDFFPCRNYTINSWW